MKLFVEINNLDLFDYCEQMDNVEGVILSLLPLSLNDSPMDLDLFDKALNKKTHLKKIVNVERIFKEDELMSAFEIVKKYQKLIDYVLLSDFGMLNLVKELGIKTIYRAPTYLTNSFDINEYLMFFDFVVISSEITNDELIRISNKLPNRTMVDLFGMNQIFYSRRPLITNYFKYKNIDLDPHYHGYQIMEETRDTKQFILEDDYGTYVYEFGYYKLDTIPDLSFGIIHLPFLVDPSKKNVIEYYNSLLNGKEASLNINTYGGAYNLEVGLLKGEVEGND